MHLRVWMLLSVMSVIPAPSVAQMGAGAAAPPVGSTMTPAQSLEEMLNMLQGQLMGAVKAMPAEKYGFAPAASTFAAGQTTRFEGVRTFGQQVAHLAQANYFFFSTVSGTRPDADVKAIADLKTKEELVKALADSFAYAHRSLPSITAANAFEVIKGADGLHTRAAVAAFAVAHGFDHYGQLVEYLRMNGVVPPASVK